MKLSNSSGGTMKTLTEFEEKATPELFIQIFGCCGVHLWNKFHLLGLMVFYRGLDSDNQKKLDDYLQI